MTIYNLRVKRFGENAPANYHLKDESGDSVGWANWLNVDGVRLGFEQGSVEMSGLLEVDFANTGSDDKGRLVAAGVYIRDTE